MLDDESRMKLSGIDMNIIYTTHGQKACLMRQCSVGAMEERRGARSGAVMLDQSQQAEIMSTLTKEQAFRWVF
jgi:hypothetical protein